MSVLASFSCNWRWRLWWYSSWDYMPYGEGLWGIVIAPSTIKYWSTHLTLFEQIHKYQCCVPVSYFFLMCSNWLLHVQLLISRLGPGIQLVGASARLPKKFWFCEFKNRTMKHLLSVLSLILKSPTNGEKFLFGEHFAYQRGLKQGMVKCPPTGPQWAPSYLL